MKDFDLLAAHLIGDYVLQTNEEAMKKFNSPKHLKSHVQKYVLSFVPFLLLNKHCACKSVIFLTLLYITHYITDTRRWASGKDWSPKPILVDQSLHAVQLAILRRILD